MDECAADGTAHARVIKRCAKERRSRLRYE
jgi:hypothetical protein